MCLEKSWTSSSKRIDSIPEFARRECRMRVVEGMKDLYAIVQKK